ncbi:MAG: hydrogenase maturation nickel metallochaperone HypA [Haloarculaceae archaeon]
MHELSIARRVVDLAVDEAREHGAATVDRMTLEVGRATHLNPDQLRFCVRTVAEDTPAAGADVAIERVAPKARCTCGWTGEPDAVADAVTYVPDPTCPDCGDRVDLARGRGCRLVEIEIPPIQDEPADGPHGQQPPEVQE